MKLKELSERTATPVSTVKYWLREGLLHPGEKRNATTAVYDSSHVERLELVTTLRQTVGLPVDRVRRVVEAVRNPDIPPAQLMGIVQSTVLGLPPVENAPRTDDSGAPGTTEAADMTDTADTAATAEAAGTAGTGVTASDVVSAMGWNPGAEDATAALDTELRRMAGWDLSPDLDTALVYARAADSVARFEMDLPPLTDLTRDRLALFVARGVFGYAQLLLRMLAVAQGSAALDAAGD